MLDPCIDLDQYIHSIGFATAYNIIKRRPPMAQVYCPSKNSYYRMEAFSISLEALKDRLDELTKDLEVVATFDFTDKDWPYDMLEMGILDPAKVTRSALEHDASVASLTLTTECMITDVEVPAEQQQGPQF